MPPSSNPVDAWARELQAGPDCLTVEQLAGEQWTPEQQTHVDECARCQAEFRLWQEFRDATPGDDAQVVNDIVAALERKRRETPGRVIGRIGRIAASPWLRLAAGLVVVAGLAVLIRPGAPALRGPSDSAHVYRSESVQVIAPKDDIGVAPSMFEWAPVPQAVRYDLVVREVDGTEFWSATSAEARLPVPTDVRSRFVPGKTLLWSVSAHANNNTVLARSETQRVRVVSR